MRSRKLSFDPRNLQNSTHVFGSQCAGVEEPATARSAIADLEDLRAQSHGRDCGNRSHFPWFIFDAFTMYQEAGPDYIHAILNGYTDAPAGFALPPGGQYNKYFPGHAIGMPKPLSDGQVEYTDGTPTTVDQYGRQWRHS
jgi:cytochrome c1